METTVRHCTKNLYVPLLAHEREEETINLLEIIKAKKTAQDRIAALKEAIKIQNSNVEVYEESIRDSARKLEYGVLADVPCKMILNWDDKVVSIIRKDTWETVETREMTMQDKPECTDEQYEPVNA